MQKGSNIHEGNFCMKKLLLEEFFLHEGQFLHESKKKQKKKQKKTNKIPIKTKRRK